MSEHMLSPAIAELLDKESALEGQEKNLSELREEVVALVPDDLSDRSNLDRLKSISEQIDHAERMWAMAEEHFHELADEMRSGVAVMLDGSIVYANGTLAEVLGVPSPSHLQGRHYTDFVHADDQGQFQELLLDTGDKEVAIVRLWTARERIIEAECTRRQLSYYSGARLTVVRVNKGEVSYERSTNNSPR